MLAAPGSADNSDCVYKVVAMSRIWNISDQVSPHLHTDWSNRGDGHGHALRQERVGTEDYRSENAIPLALSSVTMLIVNDVNV